MPSASCCRGAGWRDLELRDAASRRRLLAALASPAAGPGRLGASLPAILGGRSQAHRRMLALVTTSVDGDLVAALGRLRRRGVTVSVVHVLGAERPAGGLAAGAGSGGPGPALAAAGVRYYPRSERGRAARRARRPVRRATGEGPMTRRRLLTLACFLALAAVTALVVSRVSHPPATGLLVPAALLAVVAGGIGIARPRLWPLALVLLPLGAYLVARLQIALPADTSGVHLHIAFYAGRIADGASVYARQHFPLDPGGPELRLLLSLFVYGVTGAAAFLALSLRRPLPGVIILLCLAGFGFTIDEAARDPWSALAFVLLAGALLALAHPEPHVGVRLADALAGGATAIVAAVLALSVLGATTVEAGRPLQDWRTWDIAGPGNALMRFDWMQNYPRLLAEDNDAVVMEVRSPVASYWRANVLSDFTGTVWRGGLDADPLPRDRADGSWRYAVPRTADRGVQGRTVTQRFAVRSTFTDHLFVGGWAREIRTPLPLDLSVNAANAVSVDPARGPRTSYEVEAFVPDLRATNLIGLGRAYPAEIADSSLGLPFPALDDVEGPAAEDRWQAAVATPEGREWAGLYRLNQSVVGDEAEPYRVALAIQGYLTGQGFEYSLRPPESDYASPYAAFLFDTHIGYCQHFAGAMALLLRFNGIPPGSWSASRRAPSSARACSWCGATTRTRGWRRTSPGPGGRSSTRPRAARCPTPPCPAATPTRRRPTPAPAVPVAIRARRLTSPAGRGSTTRADPVTSPAGRQSRRRAGPGRSRWSRWRQPGRRAARCCAGAACSPPRPRRACALPSASSTPPCATTASRRRPRRPWTRRRACCTRGTGWTPATHRRASRRSTSAAARPPRTTWPRCARCGGVSPRSSARAKAGSRASPRSTACGAVGP